MIITQRDTDYIFGEKTCSVHVYPPRINLLVLTWAYKSSSCQINYIPTDELTAVVNILCTQGTHVKQSTEVEIHVRIEICLDS